MDSDGGNMHLLNDVGEVLGHRKVCRAFGKPPHVPIASTSAVSLFNEKSLAALSFLDDIIALRATDAYSKYSRLIRVCSKNPQEAWEDSEPRN